MIFAGKKVLVFGTGKSGIAAEELLHKKGASVVLYDGNDKLEKEEILKKLESRDSVEVVLGELPEEMLDSLDLVVLSPGVPTDLPVVLKMKEKEIPVIGEVEFCAPRRIGFCITGSRIRVHADAEVTESKIREGFFCPLNIL